jgi:hypothetical protein
MTMKLNLTALTARSVRVWLKPAAVLLAAVAAATALAAAGSPDVTRARIETSLTPAFSNTYVQQQQSLGHPGVTPASISASTTCDRGDASVPDVGAGSDWICMVTFNDNTGQQQSGKFELNVHSNSCYTANGPAKLLGSFTITDTTGREVPNPVNAFDVCFDPDA